MRLKGEAEGEGFWKRGDPGARGGGAASSGSSFSSAWGPCLAHRGPLGCEGWSPLLLGRLCLSHLARLTPPALIKLLCPGQPLGGNQTPAHGLQAVPRAGASGSLTEGGDVSLVIQEAVQVQSGSLCPSAVGALAELGYARTPGA